MKNKIILIPILARCDICGLPTTLAPYKTRAGRVVYFCGRASCLDGWKKVVFGVPKLPRVVSTDFKNKCLAVPTTPAKKRLAYGK